MENEKVRRNSSQKGTKVLISINMLDEVISSGLISDEITRLVNDSCTPAEFLLSFLEIVTDNVKPKMAYYEIAAEVASRRDIYSKIEVIKDDEILKEVEMRNKLLASNLDFFKNDFNKKSLTEIYLKLSTNLKLAEFNSTLFKLAYSLMIACYPSLTMFEKKDVSDIIDAYSFYDFLNDEEHYECELFNLISAIHAKFGAYLDVLKKAVGLNDSTEVTNFFCVILLEDYQETGFIEKIAATGFAKSESPEEGLEIVRELINAKE